MRKRGIIGRALERHRAKRRAKKRGKKGISDETLTRVANGMARREVKPKAGEAKGVPQLIQSLERWSSREVKVRYRMMVKNALDRMGIVDQGRRQRIQKLVEQLNVRDAHVKEFGRCPMKDERIKLLIKELRDELGGRINYFRFQRNLYKIEKEIM